MKTKKLELQQLKDEANKALWEKFKSVLGGSSIDNKNNSMYDLEAFMDKYITKAFEEGKHITKLTGVE